MKKYKMGVLLGDGIGPEIVTSTVDIFKAASDKLGREFFEYIDLPMGWEAIEKYNDPVPQITKDKLAECDGWLMAPHNNAAYPDEHRAKLNPSGTMRHHFDLFSNIRPNKTYPGIKPLKENIDLVIFRENTEGFMPDRNMYKGLGEVLVTDEIAIVMGVFTKKAATRIAEEAFKMAMTRKKKVAIVHKANVIKFGYELFRDTCYEVGKKYPEVEVEDYHIDAMTAHLVRRPEEFDVIVTTNLFGDIISDLAGEVTGSLGLAPSINTNENQAMAQAAHGSAPDIGGKNIANPIGMINSGVMLIKWLADRYTDEGLHQLAESIEKAVEKSMLDGATTCDLGGNLTTTAYTQAVIDRL